MANKMLIKSVSGHFEPRKVGLGFLTGFLLSLMYMWPSIYFSFPFSNVNLNGAPMSPTINDSVISSIRMNANSSAETSNDPPIDERVVANNTQLPLLKNIEVNLKLDEPDRSEMHDDALVLRNSTALNATIDLAQKKVTGNPFQSGNITEIDGENTISDEHKSDSMQTDGQTIVPENFPIANITNESTLEQVTINSDRSEYEKSEKDKPQREPRCDLSDPRYDLCEVDGDVRIEGNSTSIKFLSSSEKNESWRIQPYARKQDNAAMAKVTKVVLKSIKGDENLPLCTFNHGVPAIVFSTAGYTGNIYHDFTDVIIPLFITSYQFSGEVRFLVTGFHSWWIQKYLPIFSELSHYKIIDFDDDSRVHCFPHAIVGLISHKELSIDPSRSPNGYSMVEFANFLKKTYSLPREHVTQLGIHSGKKPRVLIIARRSSRKFTNIEEIVGMAEKLGCEVVVMEPEFGSNISRIAETVNSCDVMIGVHGAGLTNMVFLPTNAVLVQIVPWGNLESISRTCFGVPAVDMKVQYLEYGINEEESTLTELYPRNHTVFKDPMSLHKQGWNVMGKIYLVEQNVRLNVTRFKPVLLQALKLLQK